MSCRCTLHLTNLKGHVFLSHGALPHCLCCPAVFAGRPQRQNAYDGDELSTIYTCDTLGSGVRSEMCLSLLGARLMSGRRLKLGSFRPCTPRAVFNDVLCAADRGRSFSCGKMLKCRGDAPQRARVEAMRFLRLVALSVVRTPLD